MRTPPKDHGVYLAAWNMNPNNFSNGFPTCPPLVTFYIRKRSMTESVLAYLLVQNVPNLKEAVRQFGKLFSSCF